MTSRHRSILRAAKALRSWTACIFAAALPVPLAAQLPVEHAVDMRRFVLDNRIAVSPDGERVAYATRTAGRVEDIGDRPYYSSTGAFVTMLGSEIRVADTRTGEVLQLGDGATSWLPAWSPDGRALAFYSDRDGTAGLWVWQVGDRLPRRVSDRIVRPTRPEGSAPRWTPDGRAVIVKLLQESTTLGEANEEANRVGGPVSSMAGAIDSDIEGATVSVFEHWPVRDGRPAVHGPASDLSWWDATYGGELAAIDVATGAVRVLAEGFRPMWWEPSPNGRGIAFIHIETATASEEPVFHLVVIPAAGGEPRNLDPDVRQIWGVAAAWAPDGNRIAWFSAGPDGAGTLNVTDPFSARVVHTIAAAPADDKAPPVWRADGSGVLWVERGRAHELRTAAGSVDSLAVDGRSITAVLTDAGQLAPAAGRPVIVRTLDRATRRQGWQACSAGSGCVRLREEDRAFGGRQGAVALPDGRGAIVSVQSDRMPPDLWHVDQEMNDVVRVTKLNPAFDDVAFGETRLIRAMAPDGAELPGVLLMPPGHRPGARVPVVVDVYGGTTHTGRLNVFDPTAQLIASRGAAVFWPAAPIRAGEPAREIAETVLAGVDALIEEGIADPERVSVLGHSYGGYSVLVLITATDRFSRAIASASQGNLFSKYGQMRPDGSPARVTWMERGQGRMRATPWEARDRFIDNSPYFRLDRVRTPLLLLHGSDDPNTPAFHAEATFVALQRLGRPVTYARYEGEGHAVEYWSRSNVIDYWQRILDWVHDP